MASDWWAPLPGGLFNYSGHGVQDHGSRAIGNWWSDHATDLMTKALTPVIAPEQLTVTSVTRRASTGTGVNDGSTVFATGKSGEQYAFLHLDPGMLPKQGQSVGPGQPFARVAGGTAGGPHLHFATRNSDPDAFVKAALAGHAPGLTPAQRDAIGKAAAADVADGPSVGAVVGGVVGGVRSVGDLIGWITDPHNVLRSLQVLAGAALVMAGVFLLARQVALAADLPDPLQLAGAAKLGGVAGKLT